jgi:hypothetical protein
MVSDKNLDKLIWGCKYISVHLNYQNKLNKFSVISYQYNTNNEIISRFYLCDRKSKEMVEMVRFKIINYKIIGINILPNIYNDFVPIDEFDNAKIDMID